MTAPAEDPRSGEACGCGCDETDHGLTREVGCIHCRNCDEYVPRSTYVPAVGRGDTDSSGERQCEPSCSCGDQYATRPAVDRAEPPEGLREAIMAHLQQRFAPPGPFGFATRDWLIEADTLLALPELRRALGGPS